MTAEKREKVQGSAGHPPKKGPEEEMTGEQRIEALSASPFARLLGMERERGAIAPGYYADIVATDANPLEKIDAVRRVSFVMKNGQVVRND